jgi:hypothetical protein
VWSTFKERLTDGKQTEDLSSKSNLNFEADLAATVMSLVFGAVENEGGIRGHLKKGGVCTYVHTYDIFI